MKVIKSSLHEGSYITDIKRAGQFIEKALSNTPTTQDVESVLELLREEIVERFNDCQITEEYPEAPRDLEKAFSQIQFKADSKSIITAK